MKIIVTTIAFLIILTLVYMIGRDIYLKWYYSLEVCNSCGKRIKSGWQYRDIWACDKCHNKAESITQKKWGCEWNAKRFNEMYKLIKMGGL